MAAENITTETTTYSFTIIEIHEILFILFCIIGIFCDIIIISTILRFKKLQSADNIYIANWALINIISLLITPTACATIIGLEHLNSATGFLSAWFKLGILLHSGVTIAMFLTVFEWNLAAYFPNISGRFQKHTKTVLVIFWILVGICGTLSLSVCENYETCIVDEPGVLVSFGSLTLYVVILNIMRCVKKCRKNPLQCKTLTLNMATVFVVTWTVGLYNITHLRWSLNHPLVSLIMDCATFSSPVVNLLILYYCNNGFRECVRKVFKRTQKDEKIYHFKNPIVINRNSFLREQLVNA